MVSVYDKKENCSGCTACFHICPVNAITMISDEEGFLYPEINQSICIDCNKCVEVCPLKNKKNYSLEKQPLIYAVKNKSEQTRASSTSGGIFTAASDYILDNNGVVYGVKFDEDFNVLHDRAFSTKERDKFRGSKYVQSYLGDIFSEIVDQLQGDRKVLFSGTPCQVAGLLSF